VSGLTLSYRGRLAPSPTGYLHLGHAHTFGIAAARVEQAGGTLVLRNEDLDRDRCRAEFVAAMYEDLRWLGLRWQEGPDVGGPHAPYRQSERLPLYRELLARLHEGGWIYPCHCSRQDVLRALSAPHAGEEEPVYPGTCRPAAGVRPAFVAGGVSWRFRVPEGETIGFHDGRLGWQAQTAGRDFGDFLVWRKDDFPAYQLAVVADDAAMGITEVVRGEDLLTSTARQLLLYRAFGWTAPAFYHCTLLTDGHGVRLAKRHDALSLRALRAKGVTPETARAGDFHGRVLARSPDEAAPRIRT
jgi:glutamyl-tRNA synthetase